MKISSGKRHISLILALAAIMGMQSFAVAEVLQDEEQDAWQEQPAQGDYSDDGGDIWGDLFEDDPGTGSAGYAGQSLEDIQDDEERQEELQEQAEWMEAQLPFLESASAERIEDRIARLTKEPSPAGSDGELILSRYLQEELEAMGYTVSPQNFHEGFLNEDQIDIPAINIVAERGADSENRDGTFLLLCAHYDSRYDPQEGDPLANDKSGAAVLLEVAGILSQTETNKNLVFVFFSGEEDGYFGSTAFVESLGYDLTGQISAAICLGPVGYENPYPYQIMSGEGEETLPDDESTVFDLGTEPATRLMAESIYADIPCFIYPMPVKGSHSAFARAGIPAVTFTQDPEAIAGNSGEGAEEAETENAGDPETEDTETAGEAETEEEETCVTLARVADMIAMTAASYMSGYEFE